MSNTISNTLESLGLTCEFRFIPFSQSRNKSEKYQSLNYSVTCLRNGKPFLTTDYSMGCGHVPGQEKLKGYEKREVVRQSCETGMLQSVKSYGIFPTKTPILPKIEDVFNSLIMDAAVLNYSSFEDWAGCFGYDEDSRSGEKVYRACLEIALALRAAVGEAGMTQLSEIYQDY